MNNVRELRKKKGIQQKELALEIGVSNATVSDWEHGRKNPSGDRLRRLAEFFGVDPADVLGENQPAAPVSATPETDQIVQRLLQQLGAQPQTYEARIVSGGMDKMPKQQREQILAGVRAMFPGFFKEEGSEK